MKEAIIKEGKKILKKDGRRALVSYLKGKFPSVRELMAYRDEIINRSIEESMGGKK